MSAPTPSEAEPELAPIDYVVIEFEELQPDGEALQIVLDLVDRGIIRVLDVEIIKRNEDGSVTIPEVLHPYMRGLTKIEIA